METLTPVLVKHSSLGIGIFLLTLFESGHSLCYAGITL